MNKVRTLIKLDDRERARRATEDSLSQRLFSIILAVHAAEASLDKDPDRLEATLELIRTQSAASLEDLRRLTGLR
jgi:signal transduction histidine kinase